VSLEACVRVRRGEFELDCALEASAGETLVVAGPNGAGKSTLVEALAGLLPLDDGQLLLDGEVLERSSDGTRVPARRRSVGIVFQGLWLFPQLSARENVGYGLRARGVSRREARTRADALLGRLELDSVGDRKPSELSGGEAQRVALARALAVEPRLLMLDEPLSALDVERRPRVRALLQATLEEFSGVRLVITHDPRSRACCAPTGTARGSSSPGGPWSFRAAASPRARSPSRESRPRRSRWRRRAPNPRRET
jgi:molybdate transport system ATP-binding protein